MALISILAWIVSAAWWIRRWKRLPVLLTNRRTNFRLLGCFAADRARHQNGKIGVTPFPRFDSKSALIRPSDPAILAIRGLLLVGDFRTRSITASLTLRERRKPH